MIYMRLALLRNTDSLFRVGVIDGETDPSLRSTMHLALCYVAICCGLLYGKTKESKVLHISFFSLPSKDSVRGRGETQQANWEPVGLF